MNMFFRKKKSSPDYYFKRGNDCLNKGDHRWALESFNKAIEFNPDFEMAYYKRAETYKAMGKTREAVWDYVKFLEVDHRSPDMAEDLDDALKEAFHIARRGWQRDKAKQEIMAFGLPNLLEELMEGYDPGGEYADAGFYKLALSLLDPGSPENRCYIGFVQLLRKDLNGALEEFDGAIEENPENPDAHYFRGVVLSKMMELTEKKGTTSGRARKMKELSDGAGSNFERALEMGFKWRVCPGCGYRTSSTMNFCMRCGKKLLAPIQG